MRIKLDHYLSSHVNQLLLRGDHALQYLSQSTDACLTLLPVLQLVVHHLHARAQWLHWRQLPLPVGQLLREVQKGHATNDQHTKHTIIVKVHYFSL